MTMKKKALYYVLKYEDQYYSPYASIDAFDHLHEDVGVMLVPDRRLAIRLGDRQVADLVRKMEIETRMLSGEPDFDPTKCRVVKVVRKERILN